MRASLSLILLLASSLIFTFWPGISQFKSEDWSYIVLSEDETQVAIDNYKRGKYLREIGYYNQRFPLSAIWTSDEQYVWLIVERIDYILFGLVCFFMKPSKKVIIAYLLVKGFDMVDHLIHYNEPYFRNGPFDVTYNLVSIVVFTAYVWHSENTVFHRSE